MAGQYKQQSKGTKVIAELVEQLGWGYWVLGETDKDSDFINDIENDYVEVEGGDCFPSTKSLLKMNNAYQYVQNCDIWI